VANHFDDLRAGDHVAIDNRFPALHGHNSFTVPIGPGGAQNVEIHGGGQGDSLILYHSFATAAQTALGNVTGIHPQTVTLTSGSDSDSALPTPTITGVSITHNPTFTSVDITGTNLSKVTDVRLGATHVAFTTVSDNLLDMVSP